MSVPVKVYLNTNERESFLRGYVPGDLLRLAVAWRTTQHSPSEELNRAFRELNIDSPTTDWAKDYRASRNRSLSKGDVVVFGETAWACESVGWKQISLSDARFV
jgi:hypothetical protein